MDIRIIDSHLKEEYLKKYAVGDTFIETGTYLGDTVQLALDFGFKRVHSIELNAELYSSAETRFEREPRVKLWWGESEAALWSIQQQRGPGTATFWLDAHASGPLPGGKSGGSPVLGELSVLKNYKDLFPDDTIFIDDRRLFGSAEWGGVKEEEAINLIKEINPNYHILYLDGHIPEDVICATIRA